MSPPPDAIEQRVGINTRAFIDWAKKQFNSQGEILRDVVSKLQGIKDELVEVDKALVNLNAHREHSITWPKLIAASAGVVGLCLLISWRSVDRAEQAAERAVAAQAEMSERLGAALGELNKTRNELFHAAQQSSKSAGGRR